MVSSKENHWKPQFKGSRKYSERVSDIPANISSETSGLTCRQVKRGKGHWAVLTFSFKLLKVMFILCPQKKKRNGVHIQTYKGRKQFKIVLLGWCSAMVGC